MGNMLPSGKTLTNTRPSWRHIWCHWRSPHVQSGLGTACSRELMGNCFRRATSRRPCSRACDNCTLPPRYVQYEIGGVGDRQFGETLLADGSIVYPEPAHSQAYVEKVRADDLVYAVNPACVPSEIDAHPVVVLEAFIRQLQQEGIALTVYLPPYHPETYRRLVSSEPYKIIVDLQRTLEQLA